MILKYGSYAHPDNEVWFSVQKRTVFSDVGKEAYRMERWTITGVRMEDTVSALTTSLLALESAYADNYKDLIFYDSDGSTETRHKLKNADTLHGTRITGFRYLPGNPQIWGSGTEYVNVRTFQIVVEGEVKTTDDNVLKWNESLHSIGNGGPKWIMMGSLLGPVQYQQLQQATPFIVIQQGSALGQFTYPDFSTPLFPAYEHQDQRVQEISTPRQSPRRNTEYPIRWRYVFESGGTLTGLPNLV